MAAPKNAILYRGIPIKIEEKQNFWVAFSSSSLRKEIAKNFTQGKGTIFKIKLHDKFPHPHAYLVTISQFNREYEVLLLPFFRFKEVSRKQEDQITYIRVE